MVEFLASINSEFDVTADIFEYPEPSDRGDVDGEAIENILEIFKPLLFSAAIELGKNRHGIQQIAPKKDVLKNIADSFQNYVPYTGISLKNDPKSVWALISAGWYFRTHDTMFTDFVEAFYGSHPHRTTFSEAERRLDNLLLHSLRSLHLRSVVLTDTRLGND